MPTLEDLRALRDSLPRPKRKRYKNLRSNRYPPGVGKLDPPRICKDCKNLCRRSDRDKNYYKCGLNRPYWTNSEGTDIRLTDDACTKFEEHHEKRFTKKEFCFWCSELDCKIDHPAKWREAADAKEGKKDEVS